MSVLSGIGENDLFIENMRYTMRNFKPP